MRPVDVSAELDAYMLSLLPPREPVLARIEHEAESEGIPAVGAQEGRLLYLLSRLARPQAILELGAAIGYSAIWLARGAPAARLTTLELNPDRAVRARENLAAAGLSERATVVEANALDWLEAHREPVDLVFHDLLNSLPSEAAVEQSFERCLSLLPAGGLLIADNALRFGQVVRPENQQARNVDRWNRLVAASDRLEGVIIPMRDGVSVARVRD